MPTDERWTVAIDCGICFNCLEEKHGAKQCKLKSQCERCNALHHTLLHRDRRKSGSATSASQSNVEKDSTVSSKPHLNRPKVYSSASKPKSDKLTDGVVGSEEMANEEVGLMKITAVKRGDDGQVKEFLPLYAAVDTGATRSLCSRELGEQLYGTFNVDDYKEFHMFNGDSVRYGVMTRNLELLKCDGNVEFLGSVDFIDHSLPFSQYLPTCENLSRRVDMIFGSEFVWRYLFRLAKKHVDSETMPNGINNALEFDLGQFWLSSETQLDSTVSNLVANSVADLEGKRHVEQILPPVKADCTHFGTTSKVRLSPQDRESDLERLKQDLLYTFPNDDKLTMSRVDEVVLRNYEENVQLITLSDGKSHLQFSLSWSRDPAIMKDNYSQARDVLLRLKNKLSSRPELRSKYCDKIETAVAEGHILRVPDEVLC